MRRFILILQFMTRIPIHIKIDIGFDKDFHKTIYYFPLVGLVLGVLMYLTGFITMMIFEPFISAILITLTSVILTGGLHIDGLGDTFDAIYSNRDKEKMLEIMKDSRLGTNSLLAVMFLVLLKVGFIYSLISAEHLWAVIFMPVVSRVSVLALTYKTKTPRENGLGNLFIGKGTKGMIITAISYTVLIMLITLKLFFLLHNLQILKAIGSIIIGYIFANLFKGHIYKKIDGITGDILGCTIELGEVVYLIYICLLFISN